MRIRDSSIRFKLALLILSDQRTCGPACFLRIRASTNARAIAPVPCANSPRWPIPSAQIPLLRLPLTIKKPRKRCWEPWPPNRMSLSPVSTTTRDASLRNTAVQAIAPVLALPRGAPMEHISMASLSLFSAVSFSTGNAPAPLLSSSICAISVPGFSNTRKSPFVVLLALRLGDFHWPLCALRVSIGDPLVQLAAVARHISVDKDYSVRAVIRAGGETGLLVDSFNEMLSQIESRERRSTRRSVPSRRARSAMPLPPAARTTASGTGISLPARSTSLPAGTICLATRKANAGPAPNNGSATFMQTTVSGSAPGLPLIATARLRSS